VAARYPAGQAIVGGEVYAAAVTAIMEHELDGVTAVATQRLRVVGPALWATTTRTASAHHPDVRESVRVFKDHLTKVSSNEYDRNLVDADTAFRNSAEKLWLPVGGEQVPRGRAQAQGLRRRVARDADAVPAD